MNKDTRPKLLTRFLQSSRTFPVLTAVAAGLYPLLFYASNNYTLVNSGKHLLYFLGVFLVAPMVLFFAADRIVRLSFFSGIAPRVLPFLNAFTFLFLLMVALVAGFPPLPIAGVFLAAGIYAFWFYKTLKKLVVIQLILAVIATFYIVPRVYEQIMHSTQWLEQPDAIADVQFTKKPNVYFIQPDGYVSFSELKKGYYGLQESPLESFLENERFTLYPNFRSNYASTLTSNSSVFSMKHHYYHGGPSFSETLKARDIVISNNAVLDVFKGNGYRTVYLAEKPYMLVNKPKMGFDESNYLSKDVKYISTGLGEKKDVLPVLENYLEDQTEPTFYFIEIFSPGHVTVRKNKSQGAEKERALWLEDLPETNAKVMEAVSMIRKNDPEGLVVIMADHGGFVGMDFMNQAYEKTQDRDLIYSIFSIQMAVKWPDGDAPDASDSLKTSVNLFRVLFSYLGDSPELLDHLEEDVSYIPISKGARRGVYAYIDENGEVVFQKLNRIPK